VCSVLCCLCSFECCVLFERGVLFCVICVICVLCLIVIPLTPGRNPFAVKINNKNILKKQKEAYEITLLSVYPSVSAHMSA
jgi:hypothetical protein